MLVLAKSNPYECISFIRIRRHHTIDYTNWNATHRSKDRSYAVWASLMDVNSYITLMIIVKCPSNLLLLFYGFYSQCFLVYRRTPTYYFLPPPLPHCTKLHTRYFLIHKADNYFLGPADQTVAYAPFWFALLLWHSHFIRMDFISKTTNCNYVMW